MKTIKYITFALAAASTAACSDLDNQFPEGNSITTEQLEVTNKSVPSRVEATFNSMFSMMGEPGYTFKSTRADDFGFVAAALSNDVEASDAWYPNSGYNWFSVCGEYSSRNADYANPWNRYCAPYNQIAIANQLIAGGGDTKLLAVSHAVRAFDYMQLAFCYQFTVANEQNLNKPCVPLVTENTTDFSNNPRATVKVIYDQILSDLNYAVDTLTKYNYEPETKATIGLMAAQGLRARAYLTMGEWEKAAADADAVIKRAASNNVTPADTTEILKPGFCDINSHNWIWGVNVTNTQAQIEPYATAASWISSLSANGYSAGAGCYLHVNPLLYDKINDSDYRKQWWLSDDLQSRMLDNISWSYTDESGNQVTASGDEIPELQITDIKEPMDPYTNLKFGCLKGTGSTSNEGAYPLMRIEEMYLIKAEAMQHVSGDGLSWLATNFVTRYRDPKYTGSEGGRTALNEIWFQRRIELWGEGFGMSDIMRLQKPVVRVHAYPAGNGYPDAFSFNIANSSVPDDEELTDPWLLLRFLTQEKNMNTAIGNKNDNTGGHQPVAGQNVDLRDGVTD